MTYKGYQILEIDLNHHYHIKHPDGNVYLVDLIMYGGLYWYAEIQSASEQVQTKEVNDNTNDLLINMVSNISKQVIGIANDQDKIFKSIDKNKWTAKKS